LVLEIEKITYQERLTGKNFFVFRIARKTKSSPDKSEELSLFYLSPVKGN
jgi:hypothetical protein